MKETRRKLEEQLQYHFKNKGLLDTTTEMDHNLKGAVYYDIITRKEV